MTSPKLSQRRSRADVPPTLTSAPPEAASPTARCSLPFTALLRGCAHASCGAPRPRPGEPQRGVIRGGEPGEAERSEHEPEVAQGDVVEARVREQVDHDRAQPRRDDVAAVARLERDEDAGEDLD